MYIYFNFKSSLSLCKSISTVMRCYCETNSRKFFKVRKQIFDSLILKVIKLIHFYFFSDYQLMDDLHIGVTTSRGTVVSYDWNGINEDTENWQECLVVFKLEDKCWETQWDDILIDIVKNDCWTSARLVISKEIIFYIFTLYNKI